MDYKSTCTFCFLQAIADSGNLRFICQVKRLKKFKMKTEVDGGGGILNLGNVLKIYFPESLVAMALILFILLPFANYKTKKLMSYSGSQSHRLWF